MTKAGTAAPAAAPGGGARPPAAAAAAGAAGPPPPPFPPVAAAAAAAATQAGTSVAATCTTERPRPEVVAECHRAPPRANNRRNRDASVYLSVVPRRGLYNGREARSTKKHNKNTTTQSEWTRGNAALRVPSGR